VHDVTQAEAILDGIVTQAIVADKAYDAESLIESITQRGASAVIPPRENRREVRAFDVHHYKHRNLIERFFCRLKQFRRIATRYEKLASRFSSFIALVAAFLWLA
jgi:transposase